MGSPASSPPSCTQAVKSKEKQGGLKTSMSTNLTATGRGISKNNPKDLKKKNQIILFRTAASYFSMTGAGWDPRSTSDPRPQWKSLFWPEAGTWLDKFRHTLQAGSTHPETGACTCFIKARRFGAPLRFYGAVTLRRALTATATVAVARQWQRLQLQLGGQPWLLQVRPSSLWSASRSGFATRGRLAAVLSSHWTRGSRCYPVARSVARRRWRPSIAREQLFCRSVRWWGLLGGRFKNRNQEGGEQEPQ